MWPFVFSLTVFPQMYYLVIFVAVTRGGGGGGGDVALKDQILLSFRLESARGDNIPDKCSRLLEHYNYEIRWMPVFIYDILQYLTL